jgi:predicted TIM-barrel fold metal-dependent hydrolase
VAFSGAALSVRASTDEIRSMTRMVNEYGARIRSDHPGRFGFFACVPMPDIDGTLKETEYALDQLGADGIVLSTHYGDRFLGDPDYRPVTEELQRRKAVVSVHPGRSQCNGSPGVPGGVDAQDTQRTLMSLLFSGTLTRSRDVRWILPHAGAAVSLLAGRVNSLAKIRLNNQAQVLPDGIDFELSRLHYEIANAADLAALGRITAPSQLLLGSGYPCGSIAEHAAALTEAELSTAVLHAIERGNALRLMPQLKV